MGHNAPDQKSHTYIPAALFTHQFSKVRRFIKREAVRRHVELAAVVVGEVQHNVVLAHEVGHGSHLQLGESSRPGVGVGARVWTGSHLCREKDALCCLTRKCLTLSTNN